MPIKHVDISYRNDCCVYSSDQRIADKKNEQARGVRGRDTSVFRLSIPTRIETGCNSGESALRCVEMMLRSKLAGVISVLSPSRIALRRTFAVLRDRRRSGSLRRRNASVSATANSLSRRKGSWFGAVRGKRWPCILIRISRIRSKLHALC